jgi:flagellin-like hook-associated protein FlgL
MRVSSNQIYTLGLDSMQQHTQEVMDYQNQISSGTKYHKASDSGLAAGLSVQVQLNQSQFDMFKVNQDHLSTTYSSSETQIKAINNELLRFQQLMVQAGNDAAGSSARTSIATELQSIKTSIDQAAAAKDANGLPILKSSIHQIQVAPHVMLDSGVVQSDVMGAVDPNTKVSALDALMQGVIDQVQGNATGTPSSPTQAQTDQIGTALDQVTQAQVKVGALTNRLDAATQMANAQKTNVETERSQLLDTDLAAATAGLAKSNALLSAAQSIMAKMDINSLFQKL